MANQHTTPLRGEQPDTTPWYRQFWPWFLIALPATVVVAGISTLVIAIRHDDSLVVDDYYKQGLGINRVLAEDRAAERLGLGAEMHLDLVTGDVSVWLRGSEPALTEQLSLRLIHPTDAELDASLDLHYIGNGVYRGQLPDRLQGRRYVQLSGEQPQPWLLRSELRADQGEWLQLQFGELH